MQDTMTDWNAVDGSAGQIPHPNLDDTVYVLVKDPHYNVYIAVPGRVMALLAGQAQIRVAIRTPDGKSFEPTIITYSRSELFPSMESCLKHQLYQSMAFSCMYAADLMNVVLSVGPRIDKEAQDAEV